MILAGHQPEYLPYIGFFNKLMLCDEFVLVDHIQFNKKSWQNRNRIRTAQGELLLTVPVLTKGCFDQPISEVMINNHDNWRRKNWQSILLNYHKAPFFKEHEPFFAELYSRDWDLLAQLNEALIKYLAKQLGIEKKMSRSSELNVNGQKTELLIDLCKKMKADAYLSGAGGREYVDDQRLKNEGVESRYTEFKHPVYRQLHEPFLSNMSVIDLLFNHGNERSREIILNSGGISQ
ncbi:MAG: WbqC family protein [Candidatus Margulisiibacteriota bacterium]